MILLFDSVAVVTWELYPERVRPLFRQAVEEGRLLVTVSVATWWEIAIKQRSGRLVLRDGLRGAWLKSGTMELHIDGQDAVWAGTLPLHHRDPFDRMIITQANRLNCPVVTRDRKFGYYHRDGLLNDVIWEDCFR